MKRSLMILLCAAGMVYFIVAAYGAARVQHNPGSFVFDIALILFCYHLMIHNIVKKPK